MKITIEFNINTKDYKEYESILDDFLYNLDELGYSEIKIVEN